MKKSKIYLFPILLLCLSLLAGCGSQEGDIEQSSSEQIEISLPGISSEENSSVADLISMSRTIIKTDTDILGMQFFKGEVMEIRRERVAEGEKRETQDIYMFDLLGNYRIVLQNASGAYNGKWYFAEEGYCLLSRMNALIRIEPDGTETFNKHIEKGVVDICQLPDGRIMMLMTDTAGNIKLAELDPETGDFTKFDGVELTKDRRQYIAAGKEGVLLLNTAGFWEVDLETGELTNVASWEHYDYTLGFLVQDFRLAENGVAEIVLDNTVDTLMPTNLRDSRIVITVWDLSGGEDYKAFADLFNQTNPTYFVEVQGLEAGTDEEQYRRQNADALRAGGGADIVLSNAVSDVCRLIQSGVFEDLVPYMEASGLFQDDYFRGAFRFRDDKKVHGISIYGDAAGLAFSRKLFVEGEVPNDIETLVDALLNYTGEEVFHSDWGAEEVLNYFLCGSEDLWGMIDWEKGTCDFGGVLFAKMLEAAKHYGNGDETDLPALTETAGSQFYDFAGQERFIEKELVYVGYILDKGCYVVANPELEFLVNSNSQNKEGAWEFISFMLSEENQNSISYQHEPIHKSAYEVVVEREIREGSETYDRFENHITNVVYKAGIEAYRIAGSKYRLIYDLNADKAAEIKDRFERTVDLPIRTEVILDIIREEASAYFDETVYSGDVCANIQSRVQQYLDEIK